MTDPGTSITRRQTYTTGLATDGLVRLGQLISRSGYFADAKQEAQACVKVLAGDELGIPPIAAMTQIHLVQGRVTVGAHLLGALVRKSGADFRVVRHTHEECVIEFRRGDQVLGTSEFTRKDAEAAGLWGKAGPWKQHPRNMLWARAMSNGVKWLLPEITTGAVYTPDEIESGDFDDVAELVSREAPDWRERAREVLALAPGRAEDAKQALQAAGITSHMLSDDDVYERARQIVADLPLVVDQDDEQATADGGDEAVGWEMTDAQRRKLWATINGSGWTEDGARSVIAEVTGDRSSSSIQSRDQFDQVLIVLEAGPRPGDGQEAMEVPS